MARWNGWFTPPRTSTASQLPKMQHSTGTFPTDTDGISARPPVTVCSSPPTNGKVHAFPIGSRRGSAHDASLASSALHAQRPGSTIVPLSGEPVPIRLGGRYLVRNNRVRADREGS